MATILPVEIKQVIKILNLPSDERIINLFKEHTQAVILFLRKVTDEDTWTILENKNPEEDIAESYKYAFCYYMLSSTIEFLNLKTIGEGIIKTTGIDQQSTELLSGSEIQNYKKKLSIQTLETIEDYLNPVGYDKLQELKFGKSRRLESRTKAVVI